MYILNMHNVWNNVHNCIVNHHSLTPGQNTTDNPAHEYAVTTSKVEVRTSCSSKKMNVASRSEGRLGPLERPCDIDTGPVLH